MSNVGALLPGLYATAQDSARWTPVLDELCRVIGTRNAAMQILDRNGDYLRPTITARDSYSLVHAQLHDRYVNNDANPRFKIRYSLNSDRAIIRDRDRFDSDSAEFDGLRARLAAVGLGSSICVTFEMRPDRYFSLILHRSVDDLQEFGERDEALLNELLPHLRQTMGLFASLEEARSVSTSLQAAIDMVRLRVILCDADGHVKWFNRSAEIMIARSSMLSLRNARLGVSGYGGAPAALRQLLTAVPGETGSPVMALEQDGDMLQLRAAPLGQAVVGGRELRALFLSDAGAPLEILPADIVRLFNLSPAEARLASAIAGGASVSSYSETRGISVGTARIQLKQVLAKTQASKQADLMRQLCGSVVAQTVSRRH